MNDDLDNLLHAATSDMNVDEIKRLTIEVQEILDAIRKEREWE